MEEAKARKTGTGLHVLISKKKHKEGDTLIILKPEEFVTLKNIEESLKLMSERLDELAGKAY